jgi:phage/plasmid-like protein (TIGR03299 family)
MAAEFESGLFVREEAWHKQGVVLDYAPNTDEAYIVSGLNWHVNLKPVYCKINEQEVATGNFAIIRDKDNSVFGVVGERYVPFQNREAFDWCKPLVDSQLFQMETAGSLKGGHICWSLLKQDTAEVVTGDTLNNYLLLTWSHDGSKAIQVTPTTIRVVCNNTLQMALKSSTDITKIRHTANLVPKMEEVRNMHQLNACAFKAQQVAFKRLLDKKITTPEEYVLRIMQEIFGTPKNIDDMKDGRGKTIAINTRDTLLHYAVNGSGIQQQGIANTLYGAFNGVSEALEHVIGGKRVKDRGYNVLFGGGKDYINKAFDIAYQMATTP